MQKEGEWATVARVEARRSWMYFGSLALKLWPTLAKDLNWVVHTDLGPIDFCDRPLKLNQVLSLLFGQLT